MRTKKIVTIVLTLVVFFTAAFLGVSAVYRVEEVTLVVDHVSSPALSEAAELKAVLEKAYLKSSTIAADDEAAKEAFSAFSYFRLTGFEKDYPGRLVITATEDAEAYAVDLGGKYAVCSAEGAVLSVREDGNNRADGKGNVYVRGVDCGAAGEEFYKSGVFAVLRALDERFGGIRANVTEAVLESPTSNPKDRILYVTFREGVSAKIYAPDNDAEQKAESLYALYTDGLSEEKRLQGTIYVPDTGAAYYSPKSSV